MSNRWTSPTVKHGRFAVEGKTVDEVAPARPAVEGVDPVLGSIERKLVIEGIEQIEIGFVR